MSETKESLISDGTKESVRYYGVVSANSKLRASAANNTFKNITSPNISVRDGYDRIDYNYFRPGEIIPTDDKNVIAACIQAYKTFAIVRNTIDLMADFACKGIDLVHESARIQKVYKEWFRKINGPERTERMLNMLFKAGNCIVKRINAQLPKDALKTFKSTAAQKAVIKTKYKLKDGEIPWGYIVYDPRALEVIDGELSPLMGASSFRYGLSISNTLEQKIKDGSSSVGFKPVSSLPTSMVRKTTDNGGLIPLEQNNTIPIWYKKEDFEIWATPMLYPLLDDLSLYAKMRMADRAALDGAINYVRIWKLGNIDAEMFPTADGINHLSDVLTSNMGGGGMDLVWGPDIELQETNTEVHRFLGSEKYGPVLNAIYQGLGIPPSLSGASQSGYTNNIVSLKTMTERLEYGRMLIEMFWAEEIALVQKAFGFSKPARLVFDSPNLSDETVEKKLLIELWDRALVSDEFVQDRFGAMPDIELTRVMREDRQRDKEKRPKRSGMYYTDSRQKNDIEKSFANSGAYPPSSFGLDISPNVAPNKVSTPKTDKPLDKSGRPLGSKDGIKRKQKTVKPISGVSVRATAWAYETMEVINSYLLQAYLKSLNKSNARQLTNSESNSFEDFKFNVLCSLEPFSEVNEDKIKQVISSELKVNNGPWTVYKQCRASENNDISLDKDRQLRITAYGYWAENGVINKEVN